MIRRDIVSQLAPRLSPDGFKILVDVILSAGGKPEDRRGAIQVPQAARRANRSCPRWSASISSASSSITRAAACCRTASCCSPSIGGVRPRRPHPRAVGVSRLARAVGFPAGADRRDARRHGEQLRPQQRNHLSNAPLSRPRHDRRFRAFALGCSVGALANIDIASWLYRSNQTLVGGGPVGRAR